MVVELISVGTEILLGDIVNTNAAYLSKQCAALGLNMYAQSVVGDNDNRLKELFEEAFKRSDVVVLTGGLGPTEDDLTKETVCRALGVELVFVYISLALSVISLIDYLVKNRKVIADM